MTSNPDFVGWTHISLNVSSKNSQFADTDDVFPVVTFIHPKIRLCPLATLKLAIKRKYLNGKVPSLARNLLWRFDFIIIIIIGRLQSRRLRASSGHNDPVPIQTACPGQSCCLCLPKGIECIWETGFVAVLVFSSHVVEYTVRTPCMDHHQASWVHDPETSVGGFWHFLLAGQSELDHRF